MVTMYKAMLRECVINRGEDTCGPFLDYADPPASGVVKEVADKFLTLRGLQTDYSYDVIIGSRNFNFQGYISFSDPIRVRPDTVFWGSAAHLHVTGVERDRIYLSWEPAPGPLPPPQRARLRAEQLFPALTLALPLAPP